MDVFFISLLGIPDKNAKKFIVRISTDNRRRRTQKIFFFFVFLLPPTYYYLITMIRFSETKKLKWHFQAARKKETLSSGNNKK